MMNKSTIEKRNHTPPEMGGFHDLLGKKSVRATFKLHPTAIKLLSVLATQLGIKQKSLFDYLMEDEDALHAIAASRPFDGAVKKQRIQKTFVVSKRALAVLDAAAKRYPLSRNELIERSIQRLLPVLEKERSRYEKRATGLARIKDHFNEGNALADQIKESLGEEDLIYQSMIPVIDAYAKAVADMEKLVDKGKRMYEISIDAWK